MDLKPSSDGYIYKLLLKVFLREMESSEWRTQIKPNKIWNIENKLKSFDQQPPKLEFGEKVKLNGNPGVIRFIQYENYAYQYSIMSAGHHGLEEFGWKKEESYLRK